VNCSLKLLNGQVLSQPSNYFSDQVWVGCALLPGGDLFGNSCPYVMLRKSRSNRYLHSLAPPARAGVRAVQVWRLGGRRRRKRCKLFCQQYSGRARRLRSSSRRLAIQETRKILRPAAGHARQEDKNDLQTDESLHASFNPKKY